VHFRGLLSCEYALPGPVSWLLLACIMMLSRVRSSAKLTVAVLSPVPVIVARVVLLVLQHQTDFGLLGCKQNGYSCVSRASCITLRLQTTGVFRNHPVTREQLICESVFDTVRISPAITLTTKVTASSSSTSCIPSKIPAAVSTEVVFQMDVPLISKLDSFASTTSNKHKAFCFKQRWFILP